MWMNEKRWGILFVLCCRGTTKREDILMHLKRAGYSNESFSSSTLNELLLGDLIERAQESGFYGHCRITDSGRDVVEKLLFRLLESLNGCEQRWHFRAII